MLCTTTTTTICGSFDPAAAKALVSNPSMPACERLVSGIIKTRQKMVEFFSLLLDSDGNLSPCFQKWRARASCGDLTLASTLNKKSIDIPCTGKDGAHPGVCYCDNPSDQVITIAGSPSETYYVGVRVRGFVETKTCTGGENDGHLLQIGGDVADDAYDVFSGETSDPVQTYVFNRANPSMPVGTGGHAVDYVAMIPMKGGSSITLKGDAVDGRQAENTDGVVVSGTEKTSAYEGQFLQFDVFAVVPSSEGEFSYSPVTPSDLDSLLPTSEDDLCDRIVKGVKSAAGQIAFAAWFLNEDGTDLSASVKSLLCGIDCTEVIAEHLSGGGNTTFGTTLPSSLTTGTTAAPTTTSTTTACAGGCVPGLSATEAVEGSGQLVWSPCPDATGYEVFVSFFDDPNTSCLIAVVGSGTHTYNIPTCESALSVIEACQGPLVSASCFLWFWVKTLGSGGCSSDYSNKVSVACLCPEAGGTMRSCCDSSSPG